MTDKEREAESKANSIKRWPNINKALDKSAIIKHLAEWTRSHPASETNLSEMKQVLVELLTRKYLECPPAEIADALADETASGLMKNLLDMSQEMFGEPKDNTDSFAE